jgi:hypothetical protein
MPAAKETRTRTSMKTRKAGSRKASRAVARRPFDSLGLKASGSGVLRRRA